MHPDPDARPRAVRALGLLLDYPRPDVAAALDVIEAEIASLRAHSPAATAGLSDYFAWRREAAQLDLEEHWVAQFGSARGLSLHLYEHVHGDARERGQAMVDLAALYAEQGLSVQPRELPDYLPVLCEFVARTSPEQAETLLAELAPWFAVLAERLRRRNSPHAAVLDALLVACPARPSAEEVEAVVDALAAEPPEPEALDAAWAEEPVAFGPMNAGACGGSTEPLLQIQSKEGAP